MTDNEIIKALECCAAHPMICKECPYMGIECCTNAHRKDALDLINRQKAEIESFAGEKARLKFEYSRAIGECVKEYNIVSRKAYSEYQERVDRLKKQLRQAKAEAIKEFADIITGNFIHLFNLDYRQAETATELSKRIVKDMTGE